MKRPTAFQIIYTLGMLAIFFVSFKLGATKGWLALIFFMPLLLVLPMTFVLHIKMLQQRARGIAHPKVLTAAAVQLICMLVFYICLPGVGDTHTVYMFGFKEMLDSDLIVQICTWIAFVVFFGWVVATVMFGRYLHRTSQSSVNKKVR
jgi:hypothetical protein